MLMNENDVKEILERQEKTYIQDLQNVLEQLQK